MSGSNFEEAKSEIIQRIVSGEVDESNLESVKREVCGKFSSPKVPTNPELLHSLPQEEKEQYKGLLQRKPTRTASGVSPVAIMTSPNMCPHGKCLYCPGGPASEFSSAQSYTGHEPAAARAEQNDYDPYGQVTLRLEQLRHIGHPVDKVHLILMGGTMTARSLDYQEWFVKRAIQAMNEYDTSKLPEPKEGESFAESTEESEFKYLEEVIENNETADVRCVGITFETKPDWARPSQINRMLKLGGTKVELGVQTTFDEINKKMHRGHSSKASIQATKNLRDAGFKIGYHMMPGQPGMDREMMIEDFKTIFTEEEWKPDYLKIYPTLVVKGTRVYDMWKSGEYEPLSSDEAAEIIAEVKKMIPRYTRLQRVQRDIPANFIEAGVKKSNLRQLARHKLRDMDGACNCIRCREVGLSGEVPKDIEIKIESYSASGGTEFFISFEDTENDVLVGFLRLRFPHSVFRSELKDSAIVRELHVYGKQVPIESEETEYQHQGFGKRLLRKAEEITIENGFGRLSVTSGIGAREYYRNLGYELEGPYMVKDFEK